MDHQGSVILPVVVQLCDLYRNDVLSRAPSSLGSAPLRSPCSLVTFSTEEVSIGQGGGKAAPLDLVAV